MSSHFCTGHLGHGEVKAQSRQRFAEQPGLEHQARRLLREERRHFGQLLGRRGKEFRGRSPPGGLPRADGPMFWRLFSLLALSLVGRSRGREAFENPKSSPWDGE